MSTHVSALEAKLSPGAKEILGRVIDSDAHIGESPELWSKYLAPEYRERAPRVLIDEQGRMQWNLDGRITPPLPRWMAPGENGERVPYVPRTGLFDARAHLSDMDEEGIAKAVLYPGVGLVFAGIDDPGLAAACCRAYNDWLSDFCAADAQRLFGAAAIPLQDVGAAVEELTRAVEKRGFRAAFIRPNPQGGRRTLHHASLDPLWRRASELHVPIAIHEGTTRSCPTVAEDRLSDDEFFFLHMLSHPFEQQLACLSLIAGGVLERFPELRVVFLESGSGWAIYWLERMDEHFEHWGYTLPALRNRPSDLFRRQCFISTDPEEQALAATVELVGEDCVVWASDYPHPDGLFPGAARATLANPRLSDAQKRKVLVDNPTRLYGLGA